MIIIKLQFIIVYIQLVTQNIQFKDIMYKHTHIHAHTSRTYTRTRALI